MFIFPGRFLVLLEITILAFTMASAPHDDEFVFFVKNAGDWTTALHKICKQGLNPRTGNNLSSFDIRVRGPYGAAAQHVCQYDKILLISDGVGAAPFCRYVLNNDYVGSRWGII